VNKNNVGVLIQDYKTNTFNCDNTVKYQSPILNVLPVLRTEIGYCRAVLSIKANKLVFFISKELLIALSSSSLFNTIVYYAINVTALNDNLSISIVDSKIDSWAALNIWSSNNKFKIANSSKDYHLALLHLLHNKIL